MTFLCVVYVGELAITGGEDGIVIIHSFHHSYLIKLYLWGDDQILKKEEKETIEFRKIRTRRLKTYLTLSNIILIK